MVSPHLAIQEGDEMETEGYDLPGPAVAAYKRTDCAAFALVWVKCVQRDSKITMIRLLRPALVVYLYPMLIKKFLYHCSAHAQKYRAARSTACTARAVHDIIELTSWDIIMVTCAIDIIEMNSSLL